MAGDLWLEASTLDRGKRLDQFLHERLPQYSRSRLQDWIEQGGVLVDGSPEKRSYLLKGAERIKVLPGELPPLRATPEDLPIEILYEDADVIAVNKPAGMVVHTGAGRHSGTLVNALLHRFGKLSKVGGDLRPGIVHRLDRFTSGVILVARSDAAHRNLAEQFASRQVEKIIRRSGTRKREERWGSDHHPHCSRSGAPCSHDRSSGARTPGHHVLSGPKTF